MPQARGKVPCRSRPRRCSWRRLATVQTVFDDSLQDLAPVLRGAGLPVVLQVRLAQQLTGVDTSSDAASADAASADAASVALPARAS